MMFGESEAERISSRVIQPYIHLIVPYPWQIEGAARFYSLAPETIDRDGKCPDPIPIGEPPIYV